MYLTGYHGTDLEASNNIIKQGKFMLSTGCDQWLGDGIYFYPDFEDAYNWKHNKDDPEVKAIIHAIIRVESDEYLDIDSEEGIEIYRVLSEEVCKSVDIDLKNAQENQNAVCKMIWEKCRKVKVLSANLPRETTKLPTLIDARKKRKEFCIRENKNIVYMNKIERGEIHDQC